MDARGCTQIIVYRVFDWTVRCTFRSSPSHESHDGLAFGVGCDPEL